MYNENDYLYAGARLRAYDAKNASKISTDKLIEAKSYNEALDMLTESEQTDTVIINYEDYFEKRLEEAYNICGEFAPVKSPVSILRLPYDCHNIKSAIKCDALGISASDLYFKTGNVSPAEINLAIKNRDFRCLQTNMCAASGEAVESLAKTGDPQNVDILIDKACFDDMLSGAESFGSKFMIDYVKTKIDVYNITSFIRCSKMNKSFIFLDLILSDKGYIEKCVFNDRYSKKGENEDGNTSASKLFELLSMTQYSSLFSKYNAESFSSLSFAEVERIFDFFFAGKINSLKYIPFGPEVIIEYILNREREIKNMRLVFAGKRVSLSNDEIRLNLR